MLDLHVSRVLFAMPSCLSGDIHHFSQFEMTSCPLYRLQMSMSVLMVLIIAMSTLTVQTPLAASSAHAVWATLVMEWTTVQV